MNKYTYEQLLKKIFLAEEILKRIPKKSHGIACPADNPDSYTKCNCGADTINDPITAALKHLEV